MPWFKVDDGFAFHRKAIRAGNLAVGLWVRAGSWSAQQLTDGHIPSDVIVALGGTADDAERLVSAGLWDASEDGYEFRGWHDFQPSRESVEEEREKARKRKQAWRDARALAETDPGGPNGRPTGTDGGTPAGTDAGTGSGTDAGTPPSPTRPDPSPVLSTSTTALTLVDGSESGEKMPRGKKATRIPEPWIVDEAMKDWARERNMQPQWVMKHTERFILYWKGIGGQRGTKLDWRSTWKNWLLKAQDESPPTPEAAGPRTFAKDDVRARFQ